MMENPKKIRVLIIAYYWLPASGPGVQRVVKLVQSLVDLNVEPIILTVAHPSSPHNDIGSSKNQAIQVYRTASLTPFSVYNFLRGKKPYAHIDKDILLSRATEGVFDKVSRWIRANIFIPDANIGWIPFMVSEGMRIIRRENPVAIFSTSPPHSLHLGARKLAQRSGLPWVADFRDPWVEAYWTQDLKRCSYAKKVDERKERMVLEEADVITTTSRGFVELFKRKVNREFRILHSGFESKDIERVESERCIIAYFGKLNKLHFSDILIRALKLISLEVASGIEIHFVGDVFTEFREQILDLNEIRFHFHPFLEKSEMFQYSQQVAALLLPGLRGSKYEKGIVSAKFFDYLSMKKRIIAFGQPNSEEARLIEENNICSYFTQDDEAGIKNEIEEAYFEWKSKGIIIRDYSEMAYPLSVKANAQNLLKIIQLAAESKARI